MSILPLGIDHLDAFFADLGTHSPDNSMSDFGDPLLAHDHRDSVWAE
jgi:hypothetical protein